MGPVDVAAELRVLAFCDYFGAGSCGGSERAAEEIYARLTAAGAAVVVLTVRPRGAAPARPLPVPVTVVQGLELSRLTGNQRVIAHGVTGMARQIVREFRPNVLHANTLFFHSSVAAALVKGSSGLPLVTTMQIAGPEHLPQPTRMLVRAYESSVGRLVLRRSDLVVAVSESVARRARALGTPADKVVVVPNGVDVTRFRHRGVSRAGGTLRVVFVGRLISNKCPELLLLALRRVRDVGIAVNATFVGSGPLLSRLLRRCRRLGLDGCVSFLGEVDDVEEHLWAADVLVRPSLTEGFPLAVLEAMAARVCVVASAVPGNTDVVTDGVTGLLFRPGDAAHLAENLISLARNPDLRWRLVDSAEQGVGRYQWGNVTRQLLTILQDEAAAGSDGLDG